MQIISNIALISINETLVVQLISFLIFLFLINRIMFRPLRKTIRERALYIQNVKKEILDSNKRLEEIIARSKREEAEMRRAARQIVEELEETGRVEAGEIIVDIREEIGVLKLKTLEEIDRKISIARQTLEQEAETLSLNIMEKILERKVTQ